MARFLVLLFGLTLTNVCGLAQQLTAQEPQYDFGVIREGEVVAHTFSYKNTDDKPLVVHDVRLTCGCTAVHWDKAPLMAGDSARVTIRFDSHGKLGRQRKIITLIANATNAPVRLQLLGTVLPQESQK